MYWARRALEAADPRAATREGWLAARDAAHPAFPPASALPPPASTEPPASSAAADAGASSSVSPANAAAAAAAADAVTFPLDPSRVHIVAHVRRGDFLLGRPATSRRKVFADATYVDALRAVVEAVAAAEANVASAADGAEGAAGAAGCAPADATGGGGDTSDGDGDGGGGGGRPLPLRFAIHILSQGVAKPNVSIWSSHDAAKFTDAYADENGTAHGAGYWATVVGAGWTAASVRDAAAPAAPAAADDTTPSAPAARAAPPPALDVEVEEHISAPTLKSIGTMLAADVLLASASAMSESLGTTAGRGVLILPSRPPRGVPGVATWAGWGVAESKRPLESGQGGGDVPAVRRAWRDYRRVTPLGGWGCGRSVT